MYKYSLNEFEKIWLFYFQNDLTFRLPEYKKIIGTYVQVLKQILFKTVQVGTIIQILILKSIKISTYL